MYYVLNIEYYVYITLTSSNGFFRARSQFLIDIQNSVLITKVFKHYKSTSINNYHFQFHYILVSKSEHYRLLKISRYLNSPYAKSFFPCCTSLLLSEVESLDFIKYS